MVHPARHRDVVSARALIAITVYLSEVTGIVPMVPDKTPDPGDKNDQDGQKCGTLVSGKIPSIEDLIKMPDRRVKNAQKDAGYRMQIQTGSLLRAVRPALLNGGPPKNKDLHRFSLPANYRKRQNPFHECSLRMRGNPDSQRGNDRISRTGKTRS